MGFLLIIIVVMTISSFTNTNIEYAERVSIINLLSILESYHNTKVIVEGYRFSQFEDLRISLDSKSGEHSILVNGIAVVLDSTITYDNIELFNKEYVSIEGIFLCSPNKTLPSRCHIRKVYDIKKI